MIPEIKNIIIQNVNPEIDGGAFPIKRKKGDFVEVFAEVFREGHDVIAAQLLYRKEGTKNWEIKEMTCINPGLDQWKGVFIVEKQGTYEYSIRAYAKHYATWQLDTSKKFEAGEDVRSDLLEGIKLLAESAKRASKNNKDKLLKHIFEIEKEPSLKKKLDRMFGKEVTALVDSHPFLKGQECTKYKNIKVRVEREKACFAAWYEVFPRSVGNIENQSATWKDVENFLSYVDDLGFDVLYFPPIHPIGHSFKKGKNNSLDAKSEDPGCPYAIGNENGGHFAVNEDLGTMKEFESMVKKARTMGIEIAFDFAINCSYDHPYLKEHPDWFFRRPDGSIKYAENPPKKYEDIYPLNFNSPDKDNLWNEMKRYFLFWAKKGVKIFRVDNPHTKPIFFWKWVIDEVHKIDNEVIFLAEAFTRPRLMEMLAKAGFSQSYTYFTWRENKQELEGYFTHLTNTDIAEYMRGNLFTNTPDILPFYLQNAPNAIFKIRLALAATLSSVYGMYSGFEFCENDPIPGREEYLHSEKYEYKVWNWDRKGIKDFVRQINHIRKRNPALHKYKNLRFHKADNEKILFYSKKTSDNSNIILVIINLDAYNTQSSFVHVPLKEYEMDVNSKYLVEDLLNGESYHWSGEQNYVELNPVYSPLHILKIKE